MQQLIRIDQQVITRNPRMRVFERLIQILSTFDLQTLFDDNSNDDDRFQIIDHKKLFSRTKVMKDTNKMMMKKKYMIFYSLILPKKY